MTNYEFILHECKKAHYGSWNIVAVDACMQRLQGLTREELVRLLTSKWVGRKDEVRMEASRLLLQEQRNQGEAKIRNAATEELGRMLAELKGDYLKLTRKELKRRYQALDQPRQMAIIRLFLNAPSKQDRKWGEVREKWQKRGLANPPSIFDLMKKK